MNRSSLARYLGGLIAILSTAAYALPIPTNLGIDFRDANWAAAAGEGIFTVDGVTVDALPNSNPNLPLLPEALISQDSTDGLGIYTPIGEPDEIDGGNFFGGRTEILDIQFAPGRDDITGAWISNLFADEEFELCSFFGCFTIDLDEFGAYQLNGGGEISFVSDQADGNVFVDLSAAGTITDISFFVPGDRQRLFSDFSVVGFATSGAGASPVVEPTSLALIGVLLLGFGIGRRRSRKN